MIPIEIKATPWVTCGIHCFNRFPKVNKKRFYMANLKMNVKKRRVHDWAGILPTVFFPMGVSLFMMTFLGPCRWGTTLSPCRAMKGSLICTNLPTITRVRCRVSHRPQKKDNLNKNAPTWALSLPNHRCPPQERRERNWSGLAPVEACAVCLRSLGWNNLLCLTVLAIHCCMLCS